MSDDALIEAIQAELDYMRNRGLPTTAKNISDLLVRFKTLKECFRALVEREERLTAELGSLRT